MQGYELKISLKIRLPFSILGEEIKHKDRQTSDMLRIIKQYLAVAIK